MYKEVPSSEVLTTQGHFLWTKKGLHVKPHFLSPLLLSPKFAFLRWAAGLAGQAQPVAESKDFSQVE